MPISGARTDLQSMKHFIDEGETIEHIARERPEFFGLSIRNWNGLKRYERIVSKRRDFQTKALVLYGPTGTGKTRYCMETWPDAYWAPDKKGSGMYWDDYQNHEVVIIDEMYGSRVSHGVLLGLLGGHPYTVPVHGGSVNWCPKLVVFTSNSHPRDWYHLPGYSFSEGNALYRRMTEEGSGVFLFEADSTVCLEGDPQALPGTRAVEDAAVSMELDEDVVPLSQAVTQEVLPEGVVAESHSSSYVPPEI